MREPARPATLDVFLVAGEESGDRLGADLMRALRQRTRGEVRFAGVGGRAMAAEGVSSLYSIDNLAMIGFMAIPRRAPGVLRRQRPDDFLLLIEGVIGMRRHQHDNNA